MFLTKVHQPSVCMAVRTLVELRVFRQIVEKGKVTSDELAEITKADKILLGMSYANSIDAFSDCHTRAVAAGGYGGWVCRRT